MGGWRGLRARGWGELQVGEWVGRHAPGSCDLQGLAQNVFCISGSPLLMAANLQCPDFTRWNGPHRNTPASHIYTIKNAWKSHLRTQNYKNKRFARCTHPAPLANPYFG